VSPRCRRDRACVRPISTTSGRASAAREVVGEAGDGDDAVAVRLGAEDQREAGTDERLVVGKEHPRHVKSHVASVLSKINCRDRIQAVVFAYESGLIRPGAAAPRS
jgi:hypothetical protein